jgi:hypothetical protein
MAERGVKVDHATLNRWVVDYSPLIAAEATNTNLSIKQPARARGVTTSLTLCFVCSFMAGISRLKIFSMQ